MAEHAGIWDTHVHVLDPSNYSSSRVYTPAAASIESLFAAALADNFLLVQASMEKDSDHLLQELARIRQTSSSRTLRAAVILDVEDSEAKDLVRSASTLHNAGVRCLRLHGPLQLPADGLTERVRSILSGPIVDVARKYRWSISLSLPLDTWSALAELIQTKLNGVNIIAEHCGSVECPLPEDSIANFETFLSMLRNKSIYVKLGSLHRHVDSAHSIAEMGPIVQQMAEAGPHQLLWGSDWPHTNPRAKGLTESASLEVNEKEELGIIRRSMSDECYETMLRVTPARLFQ